MMEVMHIALSVIVLIAVLALHVDQHAPRPKRRTPKHLRPYDELRLTNL